MGDFIVSAVESGRKTIATVKTPSGTEKVELKEIEPAELDIFDAEMSQLVQTELADRKLVSLFANNVPFIVETLDIAKAQFDGNRFAGENARSNEFGFSLIRPEHVGFSTWDGENITNGWGDWVGSSSSQITNSESVLLTILGLVNYDPSPKSSAIKATIGNTSFPVWYIEQSQRLPGSLQIKELANKVYIEPENTYNVRKKNDEIGFDSMALSGIAFAEGSEMLKETPTPTSPTTLTVPST
jgi:hypothetical protein